MFYEILIICSVINLIGGILMFAIAMLQELPLAAVATTYGLLQLPRMAELKNQDTTHFPVIANFDMNKIAYKNKQRETIRLEKLEKYKATGK